MSKLKKDKLKKLLALTLIILLVLIVIKFVLFIFKSDHEVSYDLNYEDRSFTVKEIYKDGYYHFLIKSNNDAKEYLYQIKDNYAKKEKIITDIKYFEITDTEVSCIYPVINVNYAANDPETEIICSDKKTNSYSGYLYQDEISAFSEELGITYDPNLTSEVMEGYNITVNKSALEEDSIIYLYKYDGFWKITNEGIEELKLFSEDIYNNAKTIENEDYIFLPNYEQDHEYTIFYIIDKKNGKVKTVNSKFKIDKDFTINGLVDDKVYIFDSDNLIQYAINLKNAQIEEVGNKDLKGLYYDGEFSRRSIYDFRQEDLKFKTDREIEDLITGTTSIEYLKKEQDLYYYLNSSKEFYVYDSILDKKLLLFKDAGIKTISKSKNNIYFVKENKLYSFNGRAIKEVLKYEELNFNFLNRIFVYEK